MTKCLVYEQVNSAQFIIGDLVYVHVSGIELLEVTLEETDCKSKELAVNISRDLDIDALMTTMKNLYDLYVRITVFITVYKK